MFTTSDGKTMAALRKYWTLLIFTSEYLKCLHQLRIPPNLKYNRWFLCLVLKTWKRLNFIFSFVKWTEKVWVKEWYGNGLVYFKMASRIFMTRTEVDGILSLLKITAELRKRVKLNKQLGWESTWVVFATRMRKWWKGLCCSRCQIRRWSSMSS